MKKLIRKTLHVNGETIRALATRELSHAVGGFDSGAFQCPVQADSGAFQCPAKAFVESGTVCTKAGG